MNRTRKLLAITALAMATVVGTSFFEAANADWVHGSSGYSYERTPSGTYTGNYYKR